MIALLTFSGPVVHAEDASSLLLTDDQIMAIKTNCLSVQSNLQRIDENDALARYNLAQQYNIISTKLMAPMNSRIALNKLNGVALAQTTVDFDARVVDFKAAYQQYEDAMQQALKMNCKDQPVSFFDTINVARQHRSEVRQSMTAINGLLQQYRTQLDALPIAQTAAGGDSAS